jgi:hypothetical protein
MRYNDLVPKGICFQFILHLKESILAYSQFGVAPLGIPQNIPWGPFLDGSIEL